jgi:hypothetical protein
MVPWAVPLSQYKVVGVVWPMVWPAKV